MSNEFLSADAVNGEARPQAQSRLQTQSRLHTYAEALEIVPVSRPTLDSYVKRRQLPCVRIGRRVFFKDTDLRDFIDRMTCAAV